MESTLVAPRQSTRKPVSALGKVTVGAMIVLAASLAFLMFGVIGMFIPPIAVFIAVALIVAAVIATGARWTPALGAVVALAMFALNGPPMMAMLTNPSGGVAGFGLAAVMVPALIVGMIAGVAATVQNYRRAAEDRQAPRILQPALLALTAAVVGAILVAAVPAPGISTGIDPDTLAALPTLATRNFEFDQKELRVKAGETVTMRLTNADGEAHYLDIDELNVHAPIPAGKEGLAVFKATKPGTYTFYCHPHADKATKEGMVGTLIVE